MAKANVAASDRQTPANIQSPPQHSLTHIRTKPTIGTIGSRLTPGTNESEFALTGGCYSRSPVNIERAKAELVCGNLYINRGITGALVERQPFGGFRMSGGGTKAGGREYLQNFLVPRVVSENCLRRGFAPVGDE